jgi:hypothetical protein
MARHSKTQRTNGFGRAAAQSALRDWYSSFIISRSSLPSLVQKSVTSAKYMP